MQRRVAIVIAVDGLRASALGAYGNTAQSTPELDVLASQSVVVEWMLCASPELSAFYEAAWGDPPLSCGIAASGGAATLITDDPAVAEWGDDAGFANVLLVELPATDAAETVSETSLAKLFAVVAEMIVESASNDAEDHAARTSSRLFWIHTRGLNGPWDAPPELRASQLDESDPAPPSYTAPPLLESAADHDALLGFQVAYAAQVAVLDECVGELLSVLEGVDRTDDPLVALIGTSGFALGEHGLIGVEDRRVFSERLHVPCLIRDPGATPAPTRWSSLATVGDFQATVVRWLGIDAGTDPGHAADLLGADKAVRDHLIAHGRDGEQAIRTLNWMLRRIPGVTPTDANASDATPSRETIELYVKPDDRWEANEVAALCPDDVERLMAILCGTTPIESA
jgi:arylsulfatase A-like enzyme